MLDLLERYAIPAERAVLSLATCPGKPFFLESGYIMKYWQLAELPEDKLQYTLECAGIIQTDPALRALAWHLYRYLTLTPMAQVQSEKLPDIIDELGIKTGVLYLLVAMSFIPGFIARAERENFPRRYGEAAAKRIGSTTCFFAQAYDGAFGLRGRTLLFMLHYIQTATWRIGRFDFVIQKADNTIPEIYRKGDEIIAFCADGIPLRSDLDRALNDDEAVQIAGITVNGSCVTGIPIDFASGLAQSTQFTIDLAQGWERIAGPGDWTLFFHIPGGGKMTPQLCEDSFAEAIEFLASYAPDKKFRLLWSASWIFNPAWNTLLPDSNMASLIQRGRLFPATSANNPGLYFVFGQNDGDPDSFTAVNRVEKAVLQCYKNNTLRRVGWFTLVD
ncbi:MAG: hypothetical protein J6R86_00465 [Lentisphaeria bacterium]|nr:hypothetical protein [Lentisphaeria bacterium]